MKELRCDKCGASSRGTGIEDVPEHVRQFVRGKAVITMNPLGICGECYAVLCGRCANHGKCSVCNAPWPLLAECPSTPPDDPAKYRKWKEIREIQFGSPVTAQTKARKWWQFWK